MPDESSTISRTEPADELRALKAQIDDLQNRLSRLEADARAAQQEAHHAREEVMRLQDQVVAAERDQQDLRTARARLARLNLRGLLARILNRP